MPSATDARESLLQIIRQAQKSGNVPQRGLSSDYPNLAITPEHAQMLLESGIDPGVADARLYTSVLDGRFFTSDLVIPGWVKLAPCLLMPVWDVTGAATQVQIRPDKPRMNKGKPIKYESLAQVGLKLDVPPSSWLNLGNPDVPLFITEGVKKADAGASKGACIIGVLGVWGWRGKNDKGGKTALVDWESVALNGRKVRIVFDSDAVTKHTVAVAMQRLRQFLISKGAETETINLPEFEDGSKCGLDDFLFDHQLEELDQYVQHDSGLQSDTTYSIVDNRYVLSRGDTIEPLCNFVAKIEVEEIRDDGLIADAFYHISGITTDKKSLPTITVPVRDFSHMSWVEEQWRTRVSVSAGRSSREHLAAAIKTFSQNAPIKTTFLHSGWRSVDGQYLYLHMDGVVPKSSDRDIEVLLSGPLSHVRLETIDEDGRPTDHEIIDKFLELGNRDVILPILAGVFTASIGEFLTIDFAIHLEGPTGAFKSEFVSLVQGFWGREFTSRRLPANWSSTANALEHQSHAAKDMVFVIDDFAPQPGRYATEQLAQKAEVIFRGAGNQAGRARLSSDIKIRPEYFARGLIISTGEDSFTGQSLNARVISIHIGYGDVKPEVLTVLQRWRDRGYLSDFLRRYLEYIVSILPLDHEEKMSGFRDEILETLNLHKRNAVATSKLMMGWDYLCSFIDRDDLRIVAKDAFYAVLSVQQQIQTEESISNKAMEMLRGALTGGRAYMEIMDDTGDDDKRRRYGYQNIDGSIRNLGVCVGFVDDEGKEFLDPNVIHESIWRYLYRTVTAVRSALYHDGWLESSGVANQYTVPVRHRGAIVRMYELKKPLFKLLPDTHQEFNFSELPEDMKKT